MRFSKVVRRASCAETLSESHNFCPGERESVCECVWQNDGRSMWMGVKDTDILWDVSKKERERA